MKQYLAFTIEPNTIESNGIQYAVEASFNINAVNEDRARELLVEHGEDPNQYRLEESTGKRYQLGRFYPESCTNCRIR